MDRTYTIVFRAGNRLVVPEVMRTELGDKKWLNLYKDVDQQHRLLAKVDMEEVLYLTVEYVEGDA